MNQTITVTAKNKAGQYEINFSPSRCVIVETGDEVTFVCIKDGKKLKCTIDFGQEQPLGRQQFKWDPKDRRTWGGPAGNKLGCYKYSIDFGNGVKEDPIIIVRKSGPFLPEAEKLAQCLGEAGQAMADLFVGLAELHQPEKG